MSQLVISVGREYGSGGHELAVKLAEHYGLKLYDHNIMKKIAEEKGLDYDNLKALDEKPDRVLLSRTVQGMSNSLQVNAAQMQFEYLKKLASDGESFVVVGRCSDEILKGCTENLVTIFVLGDTETKIDRICRLHNISEIEAEDKIKQHDKYRKSYHNSHCEGKWGDSRSYDLTINSSRMCTRQLLNVLVAYIDERRKAFGE